MFLKLIFLNLYFSLFWLSDGQCEAKEAILWQRVKAFPTIYKLLKRSIDITEEKYGKLEISPSNKFQQDEALKELESGKNLHIALFPSDKERELKYIPVRVPLNRGILGLRVCLISPKDQKTFDKIKTLDDFNKFGIKFIVGSNWIDKKILSANSLKVVESPVYENLFQLARLTPKSCFSRSINEIHGEKNIFGISNLKIEDSLLIKYHFPHFFYVSKNRPKLAKRIKEGLKKLISTREFYAIFWKNLADKIQSLKIPKRRVINFYTHSKIDHKIITDNPELWLPLRL